MGDDWPKIKARRNIELSPWVTVIEREVEFARGAEPALYHAVGQRDYVAIVALTPDGRIPIVRQYRPALEQYTWELPAGMLDAGETAAACCVRELKEETGLEARAVHPLGDYAPCTARLSNRIHSFFVEAGAPAGDSPAEQGVTHRLVTPAELARLLRSGEFVLQLHIGALLLAGLRGHIDLAAFAGTAKP